MNDLKGKCVLITGGTMGIGPSTYSFSRLCQTGCLVWCSPTSGGSADEDSSRGLFHQENLPEPLIYAADASQEDCNISLLTLLGVLFLRHRTLCLERIYGSHRSWIGAMTASDLYSRASNIAPGHFEHYDAADPRTLRKV